jgi:parvulin-like peptidyl-prolyl isomerase
MPSLAKIPVQPEQILEFLRKNTRFKETYQEFLYQQVIAQAALERGLIVNAEEIQAEADLIRREKRLEKASDTLAWLADEMITADNWEAGIHDRLLAKKLAESLFSKEVEKFFAQNQTDFEQILLYQIIVPYQKVARELLYRIEEQEISFYEAAHLYDIDEKRRQQCGYEGKLYRWSLKPDIAAEVFRAQPGTVVGPLQTEQGHHLLRVEEFIPAELTLEMYQDILNRMFNEWLASELNYMLHNQPD